MSESEPHGFRDYLARNLWPIICAAFVFGAGYTTVNWRISALEQDVRDNQTAILDRLDAIDARLTRESDAYQCQVRTIEKLTDRTGVVPSCQM